jgi:hypothetical protein
MARDKVITVMCATRLPEILVKRIDAAAESGGVSRAQFIAEACRMRLDATGGEDEGCDPVGVGGTRVLVGSGNGLDQRPPVDMATLREICAGKVTYVPGPASSPDSEGWAHGEMVAVRPCAVCDSPMREVKGKWACADASCAMYGREVKK